MSNKFKSEIETLKNLPKIIEKYVKKIPNEIMNLRRNDTAWTIREHIIHIIQVQKMFLERIKKIRNEKNPLIEAYFPENDNLEKNNVEIKDAFIIYNKFRKLQIKELEKCNLKDFQNKAEHTEYKEYSIPFQIRHMIFHEFWHMYRIEEILYMKDEYFK